jgi:hypothetical protein
MPDQCDVITPPIEVRQHSCKSPCILSVHCTARQLECGNAALDVAAVSCIITNCSFLFSGRAMRASPQKLLLKRTTAGRRVLSTTSLTLFDVLLSVIVLPAAQVLHRRREEWLQQRALAASNAGCVFVACLMVCVVHFFCAEVWLSPSVVPVPSICLSASALVTAHAIHHHVCVRYATIYMCPLYS